jgi:sec-independent protein translocase protein TatC
MVDDQLELNGAADAPATVMPFMEHLKEARTRLIWAFGTLAATTAISFLFTKQVFIFLMVPLGDGSLQALRPTETLGNYMKVALLCGIILAMPVFIYHLARFLAPGLTKKERRYLFLLVPGATICFLTGAAFAYFIMLPSAIFFLQFFLADIIRQDWTVGDYLSFVTSLIFWIGVAFELPLGASGKNRLVPAHRSHRALEATADKETAQARFHVFRLLGCTG